MNKITVSITAQLTAYDASGNIIPGKNGITMTFTTKEILQASGNVIVLEAFDSVEIVNGADKYDAMIVDGVLKLYIAQNANYATGVVRLQVQQYDANGDIISCGTLNVYNLAE